MNNQEILIRTLEKENKLISENWNRKYLELEEKYKQEKNIKEQIEKEKNEIREQLDSILYSRSYKMIQSFKKILGRK